MIVLAWIDARKIYQHKNVWYNEIFCAFGNPILLKVSYFSFIDVLNTLNAGRDFTKNSWQDNTSYVAGMY